MKKTLFIILMIAALLLQTAYAQPVSTTAAIKVSLLNQDPDPVQPGDVVELRFKVENNGSTSLSNVALELIPEYPFTILDESVKEIGTIASQQVSKEGIIVKYSVQVAPNAETGDYTMDVRYRRGEAWVRVENFAVSVKTADADLVLNQIKVDPAIIAPGETANISMILMNSGSERLRDVKVKLELSGSDLPFAPFGSSNEYTVGEMSSKSQKEVVFRIIAKPEATADLYKLPISVSFKDLNDNKFNKSSITGLRVGSAPDILAIVDKNDITEKSGSGTVSIKIVNKGLTDLRFLVVALKSSDAIEVVSSNDVYLGKLESDDFETADFKILVKKKSSEIVLPLQIQFRDAANQAYSQQLPVTLRLLSDAEAQQLGLVKGNNFPLLIVGAVVVIAGVWWFFLRQKKRK
ncbi:MAG: COG1361 S-layer family protein [Nanoarchaeota archaeon]